MGRQSEALNSFYVKDTSFLERSEDSHVIVLVELDRKVPGHVPAAIIVSVIFHEVVHVVEDQTVPVQVFHGLLESHVEQHGSIERLGACLELEAMAAQLRSSLRTRCEREPDQNCDHKLRQDAFCLLQWKGRARTCSMR